MAKTHLCELCSICNTHTSRESGVFTVWNKSFSVSISVCTRQAFWPLLWFCLTIPKSPYSLGCSRKGNSWPKARTLGLPISQTAASARTGVIQKKNIWGKKKPKHKNQTYKTLSPGSLSWQQALKPHVLTAQLHGQGWGVRSTIPPCSRW